MTTTLPPAARAGAVVWFLDVDGTIGPLGADVSWASAFLYPNRVPSPMSVPYRPDILARIAALHATGIVDVQWLTTWEPEMTADWVRVGFGPFVTATRADGPRSWWKANTVEAWLRENPDRYAIWADDELRRRRFPTMTGRDRLLTLGPEANQGLTHADVDRVEAWVDSVAAVPVEG